MPPDQNDADDNWSGRLLFVVVILLGFFTVVGVFAAQGASGGTGAMLTWVWLGMGVSALYLLYKIAEELHRLNVDR